MNCHPGIRVEMVVVRDSAAGKVKRVVVAVVVLLEVAGAAAKVASTDRLSELCRCSW